MSKLRKKFITVLAVLFCALLAISTALFIPKNKSAGAYASSPTTADVGELYIGGTNKFSAANLRKLYNALYEGAKNLDDVEDNLTITTDGNNSIARKDIIIEFGGMKWTAMYLSRATEERKNVGGAPASSALGAATKDDVVLTLWLVNPESTAANRAQWQYWTKSGDIPGNETNKYPANMYGTSYIRSQVLNNGGAYWNQNTANLTDGLDTLIQDANLTSKKTTNKFARFTMPDVTDSVVNYLVSPRYIEWQYEQHKGTLAGWSSSANPELLYDTNNDSWGVNVKAYFEGNGKWFYADKTGAKDYYSVWKDDLLWLPSIAETGQGLDDGSYGLWKTRLEQRASAAEEENFAWLRSSSCPDTYNIRASNVYGNASNRVGNTLRIVRPAIHLNLSKAADAAKGVSFDNVGLENVENGAEFTAGEGEHTFSRVFDGKEVKVTLPEAKNGEKMTVTGANYAQEVFSAKYPYESGDRTYEVTATLQGDYVWDDTDDTTKNKEPRKYKITIKRADITVGWTSKTVAAGASLLQDGDLIAVKDDTTVRSSIKQRFYKVEPNVTESPPTDWLTNGWDVTWQQRNESSNYFTATQTGTYTVYYEIDANFHTTKRGFYTVTVSTDSVHISTNSGITISNETFGNKKAADLKSTLIDNFADWVTFRSDTSGTYSGQPLQTLLSKLEVVLLDDRGMEVVPDAGHNYYNAGTYSLGLQYIPTLPSSDKTLTFVWDTDKPQITIVKRPITVNIVVKNAGDSFTHVYGDNVVSMKCVLDNEDDLPKDEKFADLLIRDNVFVLKGTTTELNNKTPVDTYDIEGVARESNYDVSFESVHYTVTPRPITLQVADEEVEYGRDFTNYTFKAMTRTGGSLASGDTVSALTANATYKLWQNGDVAFSTTLAIGEYELRAEIPAGNYDFTIIAGKLKITTANFDMKGVTLENNGFIYDGNPHELAYTGTLPSSEISVSYRYVNYDTGETLAGPPTEVGLYIVYASFTHNSPNHNEIPDKVAYLRIALTQEGLNQGYPPLPSDEELAAAKDLAEKKTEAKKKLDEEAKAKKDAIDANADMTAEDKKAAKDEIEKELAEGNAAIDSAKDADGVNKAYDDGKKEMEDTVELAETKTDAKKDLEKEAKDKKDAIDADVNLTAEEKKEAKEEIDKQLEEGKKEIDKSTNVNDVEAAESASKKDIEDYTEVVQKKGSAKSELDKAAQAKKDAIDANPELTDEEKAAAKAEVDKELEEGKKAVDGANSIDGVQSAESSTKTNIENVKVEHTVTLDEKKSSAKSELEKAASKKKAEIDDNDELTDEEKEEAKAKVDSELQKGLNAIESAEDDEELSKTVSDRKTKIENINPEHKGSFPWWIIAVAAGVLLLAAVVIIVIKKRQTADGDEDFYDEDYDFDEEDFEEDDFADDEF